MENMTAEALMRLTIDIHWMHDKMTGPGWSDIRRNCRVHSFYWIEEGAGTFRAEHEEGVWTETAVTAGMLLYMHPGLRLNMKTDERYPLRIVMMLLDLYELNTNEGGIPSLHAARRLPLPFQTVPTREQALFLSRLFRQTAAEWVPGQPESALLAKARLYEMLHGLWPAGPLRRDGQEGKGYELFLQMKGELERRYGDPLSVRELAQSHGVSPSYLRALFHRYMHTAPKAYLNKIRHEHAAKRLLYTAQTIKEIAQACGYSDEFHFSKSFKRISGVPPSALRSGHEVPEGDGPVNG